MEVSHEVVTSKGRVEAYKTFNNPENKTRNFPKEFPGLYSSSHPITHRANIFIEIRERKACKSQF